MAKRKYCCIAVTGHNKEGLQATMRDCPAVKLSVYEDLRVTSRRCGQARLGQKVMHSMVRLNLELTVYARIGNLATPKKGNIGDKAK